MKFPIALQPYTIRDELQQDYLGSLTKVAAIGYQGVELGPPPAGISLAQFKQHLAQIGLQVIGSHARIEQLTSGLDAQIDYLHEVGGRYIGLSYRFDSRQQVLEAAERFNQIGANCRQRGIQFLYHNHNWEFTRFDGEYALDLLLEATDPELVKLELDTYWVKRGGEEPVAYLRRLHGRCPLLHMHEAVRDWEARFAPLLTDKLRAKRKGYVSRSWHVDETYIKVHGTWCYLYRAIDRNGNLVDLLLSQHRDMDTAQRFFRQALDVTGQAPERVTTDGHDSYPRAIRETLGEHVHHRCNPYPNNRIEQDHRGVKQRYYPMRGSGNVDAASRFCRAFDEQRQYFRLRIRMGERVPPLCEQRRQYCARWQALMGQLMIA